MAGYDRCLVGDRAANQLAESLLRFETILSLTWLNGCLNGRRWFDNSSIVLILNKMDIFKRKIRKNALKAYFPDYVGREKDYEAALTYIVAKFKSQQRLEDNRIVHIYFTDATNIRGCQAMLQDIEQNMILKESARQKLGEHKMIGVAI
ncbi:MAG: hypothetical protein Q9224_005965 [Gallowayella concinna]